MTPQELRKALKDLELSQAEAARRLYVTPRAVNRWIVGDRKIPGPAVAAIEAWFDIQAVLERMDTFD